MTSLFVSLKRKLSITSEKVAASSTREAHGHGQEQICHGTNIQRTQESQAGTE